MPQKSFERDEFIAVDIERHPGSIHIRFSGCSTHLSNIYLDDLPTIKPFEFYVIYKALMTLRNN